MSISKVFISKLVAGGIEISDSSVSAVLFAGKGNKVKVSRKVEIALPAGVVVDGKVTDKKRLVEALRRVARKAKLKNKYVVLTVPESTVFTQNLKLPKIPADQINEYLELNPPSSLPFPKNDLTFGWQVIDFMSLEGDLTIFFATTSRSTILTLADAAASASMTPVAVESTSSSIARVVPKSDAKQLVVFLRAHEAVYLIITNGVLISSFSTKNGLAQLSQNGVGQDAVKIYAKETVDEITKVLRFQGQGVGSIIFASELDIAGLADEITKAAKHPVVALEFPLQSPDQTHPYLLLPAYGAALRGLNLSASDKEPTLLPYSAGVFYQHRQAISLYRALFNIAISAAVAVLLFLMAGYGVLAYQKNLLGGQANKTKLSNQNEQLIKDVRAVNADLAVMKNLYHTIPAWSKAIELITPLQEGVRYTGITIQGVNRVVTVSGNATTLKDLESLIGTYRTTDAFSQVEVPNQFLGQPSNINFIIKIEVRADYLKAQ